MTVELDAGPPPARPYTWGRNTTVVAARIRPELAAWCRAEAAVDGLTVNAWLGYLIEASRETDQLPNDVRDWLATMANVNGLDGQRRTLVAVLRNLSRRYPVGAVLHDPA